MACHEGNNTTRGHRLLLVACGLIGITLSCVTNESGRQSLNLVSDAQMEAMGLEAYAAMSREQREVGDTRLREAVTSIAREVAAASGAPLPWEFRVFDSDDVNAFCLPGGKIGIYRGILPVAKTNAALAAVIGHEIAHATLRHGNERVSQGLLVQLGLQASDLALGDNTLRGPLLAALGLGAQVGILLPFGRLQESEADTLGLRYLMRAGYDGAEAAALWKRMAEHSHGAGTAKPPAWLSTHPDDSERQRNLAELAAQLKDRYPTFRPTAALPASDRARSEP